MLKTTPSVELVLKRVDDAVVTTEFVNTAAPIPWPPSPGQEFHINTGYAVTSYSAIVCAYLEDDNVVVFKCWSERKERWRYMVESQAFWESFSKDGALLSGRLPTGLL